MTHCSCKAVGRENIRTRFPLRGLSAKQRHKVYPCMKMLMAMVLMPLAVIGLELNPSFSPEAVAKYKEKADAGDAEAQHLYARALIKGEGAKQDKSAAFEYAKKSADQGCGLSYYYVGAGYRYGWNGSTNKVESAKWYGKFVEWAKPEAEKKNAQIQDFLGDCYCRGLGVEKDLKEAAVWYQKAAEQGHAQAQCDLGRCYYRGDGVKKDYKEAVTWYRKAAEQGHAQAQCDLGRCYYRGDGVKKDYKEAVTWYRKAAEQGNVQAPLDLGYCYRYGDGVERDQKEAVTWYRKAAERGHRQAQYDLGRCYYSGDGVEKDLKEAAAWYQKAAERGHRQAKEDVAELAKELGIEVEELSWLLAEKNTVNDDNVMEIKKKSEAMKKDTLVFKGMHLGMSVEDARYVIQSFGGSVTSEMLDTKSGKVNAFKFKRIVIDRMFKTEGVSSEAFCKSLLSAYPIIEKLEIKYETIADVERQKKYKQDAENAAMRTFANMASNGQDAYELGAAIGSKIRMNANQMTKEVPYYYFESPKGFVLEIHPDRSEMFFVLRSIAAIDTSNFD